MKRVLIPVLVICALLAVIIVTTQGARSKEAERKPVQDPITVQETETTPVQQEPVAARETEKKPVEKPAQKNPVAVMEMAKGGIVEIELFPKDAPITVANYVKLVKTRFYDGLTFHRVIPGFVAQTGSPNGQGTDGPGWTIKDEQNSLVHNKGAVGMAKKTVPDSAGSQWYICLDAAHHLDGGYTVFGKVIKGMDIVERIQIGDKIKKITLREPPKAEKK